MARVVHFRLATLWTLRGRITWLTKDDVVCGFAVRFRGRWHGWMMFDN